jgi:hypothetical protein
MPLNTKQYRNNRVRSPMRSLPKRQTWHSGARVLQEAPEFPFLLGVFALVVINLAARIAVVRGHFDDLPPLPREH